MDIIATVIIIVTIIIKDLENLVKKEDVITSITIKDLIGRIGTLEIEVVRVAVPEFLKKERYTVLNKTTTHHVKGFINKNTTLKVIKL